MLNLDILTLLLYIFISGLWLRRVVKDLSVDTRTSFKIEKFRIFIAIIIYRLLLYIFHNIVLNDYYDSTESNRELFQTWDLPWSSIISFIFLFLSSSLVHTCLALHFCNLYVSQLLITLMALFKGSIVRSWSAIYLYKTLRPPRIYESRGWFLIAAYSTCWLELVLGVLVQFFKITYFVTISYIFWEFTLLIGNFTL